MSYFFEWDLEKAKQNLQSHDVSFDEAAQVFDDPLAKIFYDEDHSHEETRELIIGHSNEPRLLIVSFTEREQKIRLISARTVTRRERRDYEENKGT